MPLYSHLFVPAHVLTIDCPSRSRHDSTGSFNLKKELKKILFNKKERIVVCANQQQFQDLFLCFHNYEVSLLCTCDRHCVCYINYYSVCLLLAVNLRFFLRVLSYLLLFYVYGV